ncbi:MAG: FAD binding domain-containing protein [Actinomycetota bacterium]|nr:FAD binding domain-containing protein [Actinomycetota bacterium]
MSFTIATTVDEALVALGAGARPIAGGTDLVVGARHGKAALPADLVAIDRIGELGGVELDSAGVRVGALMSHAELMTDPVIVGSYTALADASALVGSPSTRHVGTLGGNVMNGSPAMDTGAPLTVLGAAAELRSVNGRRTVALDELWAGPGRTTADPGELLVALHLPPAQDRCGSAYVRLEYRRAMEIAVVGAAAAVTLAADGTVASAAVALAAVAPTILSVDGVDEALVGCVPADAGPVAAALASEQAAPISDLRASDRYRRHCIGVMAKRAVDAAARRADGESIAVPVNRSLGIGAA